MNTHDRDKWQPRIHCPDLANGDTDFDPCDRRESRKSVDRCGLAGRAIILIGATGAIGARKRS